MKRILVRGGMNPLKPLNLSQILAYDKIGGNTGNILYLTGVLRSIYADDVEVDVDGYAGEGGLYNSNDIDQINQIYDAYLIPLADAFRPDFVNQLNSLTKLVKQLKIPCHILSVGIRGEYDMDVHCQYPFDEQVKEFVKAVLEKSPMIGVRGEITAEYLQKFGLSEEKDYTVIGCPSMYIFGKQIHRRKFCLDKSSRLSLNFNPNIQEITENLLECARNQFGEWLYVAQGINEIKCLWLGLSTPDLKNEYYLKGLFEELYGENHVRAFISAGDWIRYMNTIDLSIGGKLHGNIAAVLGGAPTIFIPSDARMQELVSYHSFPSIAAKDWKKIENIEKLVDKIDLDKYLSVHTKNFEHYCEFLEKLEIPNIYSEHQAEKEELLSFSRPVTSILNCSKYEMLQRLTEYKNAAESFLLANK